MYGVILHHSSPPPPSASLCWFSLNNSETVKAVTWQFAAFSQILLKTFVPNLVFLTSASRQILGKNSDGGIYDFQKSGQSLIKINCHNSRTGDDIEWPVTKRDKRNNPASQKFNNNVMPENLEVIVIFPIYDQFRAIQKPDSGRIDWKSYILINSNLSSYKNWKQN